MDAEALSSQTSRPRVIALAAITADGKIARAPGDPANWTSREDKRMFVAATKKAGAVIVGRTTFETFPQPLRDRLQIVLTSTPERHQPRDDGVEYRRGEPDVILAELARRGYTEVALIGGAKVYAAYLGAGLVDELWFTIEPLLFGRGVSLCGDGMDADVQLRLQDVVRLNEQSVQLRYGVRTMPERAGM